MEINLYKPQSPLLQKHIECFYTLTHSAEDGITTYLTFPNIFTIVSSVKDAQTTSTSNYVKVIHCPNNAIETDLVCNYNEPVLIQYEGETSEVVVLFKPLGINAFLDNDLNFYSDVHMSSFDPFEDFESSMKEIFSVVNDKAKIEALENYWLSKFKGFEHPFLFEVISDLMNKNNLEMTISELSEKHKISRVTLNKHFKKHICKTPSQFRKIVRFRNAMKCHASKSPDNQLTDITYSVNYFDQSHMIKDFKALTGYSPKAFFSKISKIENGEINWLFL